MTAERDGDTPLRFAAQLRDAAKLQASGQHMASYQLLTDAATIIESLARPSTRRTGRPDIGAMPGTWREYADHLESEVARLSHALTPSDYEEVLADHRRVVREIDVILNGEAGAAKQASLIDLIPQIEELVGKRAKAGSPRARAAAAEPFIPAYTSDDRLVIVNGAAPQIFNPEQTEAIATLLLNHFDT